MTMSTTPCYFIDQTLLRSWIHPEYQQMLLNYCSIVNHRRELNFLRAVKVALMESDRTVVTIILLT